jgi:hypothetical protein
MDKDFAMKHSLELIEKAHPTPVEVIDGRPLVSGNVMEETQPLEVMLGDQVSHIVFNIIQCPANLVVLDLLWFELYNPDIDWSMRTCNKEKYNICNLYCSYGFFNREGCAGNSYTI